MASKVNVVHSIASLALKYGGPSYTVSALASAQQVLTSGSVHIVAGQLQPGKDVLPVSAVQVYGINQPWPRSLLATRAKLAELLSVPHSVLHDQGIWHLQNLAATGFAAQRQLPYVISTHGMLEPWTLKHHPVRKKLARWLYQDQLLRKANCLMATSPTELASIRKAGFVNPVAVIANGMDSDIPVLKRSTDNNCRTVLFLSRIHPVKGLIHAIDAWNVLRPENWQLKIVGPNENHYREKLEDLVKRYKLQNCVKFYDAVAGSDKYQHYYDADVFLLPSFSENFGVVVAEALACGLPVITTTGTPWRELTEKSCGWYVETGTAPLIAALREAFNADPEDLKTMGRRGQTWVKSAFTWPSIATYNLMVYEWLLGQKSRPEFIHL